MVAATALTRAQQIVQARIGDVLAPHGLTFPRYEVLALLAFSRAGELPLGKIGVRLQVHPASLTYTVDRLEADGLVERVPHPTDRRTVLARLTETGRDRLGAATASLVDAEFGLGDLPIVGSRGAIDDALQAPAQERGRLLKPVVPRRSESSRCAEGGPGARRCHGGVAGGGGRPDQVDESSHMATARGGTARAMSRTARRCSMRQPASVRTSRSM